MRKEGFYLIGKRHIGGAPGALKTQRLKKTPGPPAPRDARAEAPVPRGEFPPIPRNIHSITEFNRGQASKIIRNVAETGRPVFIMKNTRTLAVLVSPEHYEQWHPERNGGHGE